MVLETKANHVVQKETSLMPWQHCRKLLRVPRFLALISLVAPIRLKKNKTQRVSNLRKLKLHDKDINTRHDLRSKGGLLGRSNHLPHVAINCPQKVGSLLVYINVYNINQYISIL